MWPFRRAPPPETVGVDGSFRFPPGMRQSEAEALLAHAYNDVDPGRVLRRALKLQRGAGLDPPHDVQYVSEPRVERFGRDLGVTLASDVLAHEAFEGMDDCVDLFERVLGEEIIQRLERSVRRRPAPSV